MYARSDGIAPMLYDSSYTDHSPNTSWLSDGAAGAACLLPDSPATAPRTAIDQLTELDHALVHVAECMRTIRSGVEAAKRRREFLDSAIRGNLVEMSDGQFKQMSTEQDRFSMLNTVMTADQSCIAANEVFYLAFNKTVLELQAIAIENGQTVLNSSVRQP